MANKLIDWLIAQVGLFSDIYVLVPKMEVFLLL